MARTLLLVSGGVEAVDAIRRAKELGLHVVVSDGDSHAPGLELADDRLIASVYNPEQTAAAAERYHRSVRTLDGVICAAVDAALTVATVAHRLGLPGLSLESARLASDKLAMKRRLDEGGVRVPRFAALDSAEALRRLVAERGRELVIKPVDSRGGRGVQRVASVEDLDAGFDAARRHSPSGRVMVEEYIEGPQVSTESIVSAGVCVTPGFSDRNYELLDDYAPFFVENGGELPSALPDSVQAAVRALIADAAAALGIADGTVKGDVVVRDGEPYLIELAARLSGGFFCTREIPLSTGVDLVGAAIRIALGEQVDPDALRPRRQEHVVQRYVFPEPGRVLAVRGAERARVIPGIADLIVTARPGDVIPAAGDKRPSGAMVLATGSSRTDAIAAAQAAVGVIEVSTG
jgi:biotin carboxylase